MAHAWCSFTDVDACATRALFARDCTRGRTTRQCDSNPSSGCVPCLPRARARRACSLLACAANLGGTLTQTLQLPGMAYARAPPPNVHVTDWCLESIGLDRLDAMRSLRILLLHVLSRCVFLSEPLWEGGAPAFALASLEQPLPYSADGTLDATLPPASDLPTGLPPSVRLRPLPRFFEQIYHDTLKLACELCGVQPPSRALCLACGACLCGLDTHHGPRGVISHAQVSPA